MKQVTSTLVILLSLAFFDASNADQQDHYALAIEEYSQDRDLEKIIKYLKQAAGSNAKAQSTLGDIYSLKGDSKRAFKWHKAAAENGDPWAQLAVALSYYSGEGIKKDLSAAYSWYVEGSRHELELSDFPVYQNNSPFFKISEEFNNHVNRHAEDGGAILQYIKAIKLIKSELVLDDKEGSPYKLAEQLLEKSAKQNYINAQVLLAVLYQSGFLGEINKESGLYWINKALNNESFKKLDESQQESTRRTKELLSSQ